MASKTRSAPSSEAPSSEGQAIDSALFDGLMTMAATAGNELETDEPDLTYPVDRDESPPNSQ